jgi:AraC family transcriptional regulator
VNNMTNPDLYTPPRNEQLCGHPGSLYSELVERTHRLAVGRVIGYMRSHFVEPISLKDLAKVAHCSPWHLDRIFADATGLTPMRYLSLLRIEMAKLLVINSNQRIIEIAYDVGYNSLGSFGKRFTELVGMSPRQLRKAADRFDCQRWRDALEDACSAQFYPSGIPSSMCGALSFDIDTADTDGWSFVAAVTSDYPCARPATCTVARVPGLFRLAPLPAGRYTIVAIAFPRNSDTRDILTQRASPRARIEDIRIAQRASPAGVDIVLHAPRMDDAPLTPSYAVLFDRFLAARGHG